VDASYLYTADGEGSRNFSGSGELHETHRLTTEDMVCGRWPNHPIEGANAAAAYVQRVAEGFAAADLFVELHVKYTEPGVRGWIHRAGSVTKAATMRRGGW